jgi:hypothetical protein
MRRHSVRALIIILSALYVMGFPLACSASYVLTRAAPYLPILSAAFVSHWPDAPIRQHAAGQVEQESSWKSKATLKTSRELGRGLTQMTIAYTSTGKERFNIYRDAVQARALKGWDWKADPYNVRYQLTFLVLQDKSNYMQMRHLFASDEEAVKAELVSYNAGAGRVLKRRAYALLKGLPCDKWTGGLDGAYSPKEAALLYGRPLYEAVNEYPRVIFQRAGKYRGLL